MDKERNKRNEHRESHRKCKKCNANYDTASRPWPCGDSRLLPHRPHRSASSLAPVLCKLLQRLLPGLYGQALRRVHGTHAELADILYVPLRTSGAGARALAGCALLPPSPPCRATPRFLRGSKQRTCMSSMNCGEAGRRGGKGHRDHDVNDGGRCTHERGRSQRLGVGLPLPPSPGRRPRPAPP